MSFPQVRDKKSPQSERTFSKEQKGLSKEILTHSPNTQKNKKSDVLIFRAIPEAIFKQTIPKNPKLSSVSSLPLQNNFGQKIQFLAPNQNTTKISTFQAPFIKLNSFQKLSDPKPIKEKINNEVKFNKLYQSLRKISDQNEKKRVNLNPHGQTQLEVNSFAKVISHMSSPLVTNLKAKNRKGTKIISLADMLKGKVQSETTQNKFPNYFATITAASRRKDNFSNQNVSILF